MIIIIDNYDSFTYNLYQYIGEISPDIEVFRNDKISVDEIRKKAPSHVIISPGPGFPADAGISIDIIRKIGIDTPLLGVCLGHQGIAEAFGGRVVHAPVMMHGKASEIRISADCDIFRGLPERITAGRYHSLVVEKESLPQELEITAISEDGEIMGLKHGRYKVYGIQFHPESVLTPQGKRILQNFLQVHV